MNKFFKKIFFKALEKNYTFIVNILLKFKIDINMTNEYGKSLLCESVCRNNEKMVRLLLSKGANINSTDRDDNTPIMWAILNNNKSMVDLLVKKGADVNITDIMGISPIIKACELKRYDIALKLIEKSDLTLKSISGETILHVVCADRNENIINEILTRAGQQIGDIINVRDKNGNTPLMLASRFNSSVCKKLLNNGADDTIKNNRGETSLIVACKYGQEDVVKMLLDRGRCKIDDCDKKGETSLMHACKFNRPNICKILLKRGANVNLLNNMGQTSLILACIYGNREVVQVLLNKKTGNIYLKDASGKTALDYVKESKREDIERLIVDWENEQPSLENINDKFTIEPQVKEKGLEDLYEQLKRLEKKEEELQKLKKAVRDDNVKLQSTKGLVLKKSGPSVSISSDKAENKVDITLTKISVKKRLKEINSPNIPETSNNVK